MVAFQSLFGPISGKLDIVIGSRYTCLTASGLMAIGVFSTRFGCDNFWISILTLGVLFGSGLGIGFTGSIIGACAWWPNKAIVAGFVLGSMGFGQVLFNTAQTTIINPKDIKVNPGCGYVLNYDSVLKNIPNCFSLLTLMFLGLSFTGVALLSPTYHYAEYIQKRVKKTKDNGNPNLVPKTPSHLNRYDLPFLTMTPARLQTEQTIHYKIPHTKLIGSINSYESSDIQSKTNKSVPILMTPKKKPKYSVHVSTLVKYNKCSLNMIEQKTQYTLCEALKTLKFWQLYALVTMNYTMFLFFVSQWKVMSQRYFSIHDDYFLLVIGNASGILFGCGRIIWGIFFDYFNTNKYQFNIVMGTLTFLVTILVAILPIIHKYLNDNQYVLLIVIALILFTVGSTYVPIPTTISKSFGIQYAGVIFGVFATDELLSSLLGALLYNYLHNDWIWIFIIFIIMGIISLFLVIMYRTENDKIKELKESQQ